MKKIKIALKGQKLSLKNENQKRGIWKLPALLLERVFKKVQKNTNIFLLL